MKILVDNNVYPALPFSMEKGLMQMASYVVEVMASGRIRFHKATRQSHLLNDPPEDTNDPVVQRVWFIPEKESERARYSSTEAAPHGNTR